MAKLGFLIVLLSAIIILSSLAFLLPQPPVPAPSYPILQIGQPTPASGCYYLQVQCIRAPCDPILTCPSPTTSGPQPTTAVTPTCIPRPKCLDATPRCLMPETPDMCPPSTTPRPCLTVEDPCNPQACGYDPQKCQRGYECPPGGWLNCMPILTPEAAQRCTPEGIAWVKAHCPDFQGVAY